MHGICVCVYKHAICTMYSAILVNHRNIHHMKQCMMLTINSTYVFNHLGVVSGGDVCVPKRFSRTFRDDSSHPGIDSESYCMFLDGEGSQQNYILLFWNLPSCSECFFGGQL